jgi:hypothetical protein
MLKRFRWGVRVTSLAVGLAVTCAMAFFIGSFMADGTHTGTAGSGGTGTKTLPISLNWEDGKLTPTHAVPLTATFTNTSKGVVKFSHAVATFSSSAPGCEAKWFRVKSSSSRWTEKLAKGEMGEFLYAPGAHSLGDEVGIEGAPPTFTVEMVETEVDQSACEGAPVTLEVKLTE